MPTTRSYICTTTEAHHPFTLKQLLFTPTNSYLFSSNHSFFNNHHSFFNSHHSFLNTQHSLSLLNNHFSFLNNHHSLLNNHNSLYDDHHSLSHNHSFFNNHHPCQCVPHLLWPLFTAVTDNVKIPRQLVQAISMSEWKQVFSIGFFYHPLNHESVLYTTKPWLLADDGVNNSSCLATSCLFLPSSLPWLLADGGVNNSSCLATSCLFQPSSSRWIEKTFFLRGLLSKGERIISEAQSSPQNAYPVMWNTVQPLSSDVKHCSLIIQWCETLFTHYPVMWNTVHPLPSDVKHCSPITQWCETLFIHYPVMWNTVHPLKWNTIYDPIENVAHLHAVKWSQQYSAMFIRWCGTLLIIQ